VTPGPDGPAGSDRDEQARSGVLFVCTGNQCRSPMAAALLGARLSERGSRLRASSAGFLGGRVPPPEHAVRSLRAVGLDISSHRSRAVGPHLLDSADLIVAMTRQHLFDLATADPPAWPRCFTFAEVLSRGTDVGPRLPHETLDSWVERLGSGRTRSSLIRLSLADDVPDPIGQERLEFDRVRDLLEQMTSGLASLIAH
jgi:protein-tyrosine phosphatase